MKFYAVIAIILGVSASTLALGSKSKGGALETLYNCAPSGMYALVGGSTDAKFLQKFDFDNNGIVDAGEFLTPFKNLGGKKIFDLTVKVFEKFDVNHNFLITFDEAGVEQRKLDINGDGKIEFAELLFGSYKDYMALYTHPTFSFDDECGLKEIYLYAGSFKEGMTYSDFVAKLRAAPESQGEQIVDEVQRVFRDGDKDFSGYLTASEYANASDGDLDGDGKVYFPGSVIAIITAAIIIGVNSHRATTAQKRLIACRDVISFLRRLWQQSSLNSLKRMQETNL